MRRIIGSSLLLLVVSGCATDAADDGDALQSLSDRLVGGHVATEAEYPATVSLGGCTGVKVGPRHFLSAAHCFGDSTLKTLAVTSDNDARNFQTLTLVSINIHPEYTTCSACAYDGSMSDFGLKPDVALLIVQEPTPGIPIAMLDPTPVGLGASVTLTGYGCENGIGQPSGPARFKVGDTHSIDPLQLSDATSILDSYVTSFGPGGDASAPGLCSGDSGGPLFRTGTNRVVGVGALVSYGGEAGTPYGNWFTRLDHQSRYDIYTWLTGLVGSVESTPCSDLCASPKTFRTPYFSSENMGTLARCYQTTAHLRSGNCGGFFRPDPLTINGISMNCDGRNWTLPAKRNDGYCFKAPGGQNPWAYFDTF
jgi:trypsin